MTPAQSRLVRYLMDEAKSEPPPSSADGATLPVSCASGLQRVSYYWFVIGAKTWSFRQRVLCVLLTRRRGSQRAPPLKRRHTLRCFGQSGATPSFSPSCHRARPTP